MSSAPILMPTRWEASRVFSCKAAPPETSVRLEQNGSAFHLETSTFSLIQEKQAFNAGKNSRVRLAGCL